MKIKDKTIWIPLLIGGCAILLTFFSLFNHMDLYLSDRLYQKGDISSGKIVIIEIDEKALEEFGPSPLEWDRSIYADVINYLNASFQQHPAVIGLDILFSYDKNAQGDQKLAEAASFGNVVTAGKYYYGTKLQTQPDGSYTWQNHAIVDEIMPYDALKEVTEQGIVNVTNDADGIIRHAVFSYDGEPSFAQAIVKQYAAETGTEISYPKRNISYLPFTYNVSGYLESISLADVYHQKYPVSYFDQKIVLIGSTVTSLQDEYLTAINRREAMNGVEIHANTIDMMLRGDDKAEVSDNVQRILLLLLLVICILLYGKMNLPQMSIMCLIIAGGWIFASSFLFDQGIVVHPLWIPAGIGLLYISEIALRFVKESYLRRQMRQQFERYVDPAVLHQIIDHKEAYQDLDGKQSQIAVLFVDICGFTSLSEKISPKEVVNILNQYLSMVTECIMQNGGTLDKFIGDCAMAFWNAPVEQDDPVMKAVQAGMDMISGADQLSKDLGFDLGFAVGIHCGEAIVGNIGSAKRMDFTAIGDTVNLASRLEGLKIPGLQREGNIYISQEVKDVLEGRIETEDLGDHIIKGKEKPVRVYAVKEVKL